MKTQKIPWWLSVPLVLGTFGLLVWLERRRPLRGEVESKLSRGARNLAVAGVGAVVLQLTESPVALRLTALVEQHNLGLLKRLPLPPLAGGGARHHTLGLHAVRLARANAQSPLPMALPRRASHRSRSRRFGRAAFPFRRIASFGSVAGGPDNSDRRLAARPNHVWKQDRIWSK